MVERGKRSKGLQGKPAKRFRSTIMRDRITKPAIRRMARGGGVKRTDGTIYEETRIVLKIFLENIIRDAVPVQRKTVTTTDVVAALKRQGRILYGFGGFRL